MPGPRKGRDLLSVGTGKNGLTESSWGCVERFVLIFDKDRAPFPSLSDNSTIPISDCSLVSGQGL